MNERASIFNCDNESQIQAYDIMNLDKDFILIKREKENDDITYKPEQVANYENNEYVKMDDMIFEDWDSDHAAHDKDNINNDVNNNDKIVDFIMHEDQGEKPYNNDIEYMEQLLTNLTVYNSANLSFFRRKLN